ncbi:MULTISPECIES: ABC transporter ATP-binding protein [unclassified Leptotrichia]|jgi:ABC transporter related protein|uniref:ABC transporter ATP-binding protein n=1 Tax=unclassified Leptotrichia TaxID=2633022 RepID=UPI0017A047CC|nr:MULTISPECIES: ABC transporter ATP-binding protein [unclassified Leptotrichia]MBB1535704.1 ABC transporter ATP-binding protein [Leptotrichia sp.]QUB97413.1 ABC transporter ATP-binding protein [Leptotrichia sp. oral taxon 221]
MSLLKTTNLGISFGGLRAVDDVNIEIKEGELIGLIGPNGAGKTTIFNLLTGVYKPTDGDISINGTSVNKKTTPQIVTLGVARTFQNIRLFKNLSVLDNVKLALNNSMSYSTLSAVLRLPKYWREERIATDTALDLLDIFDMAEMANITAGNLSYGQQRKLEIARALATSPKLLLLDEPAAGMNPNETKELMNTIRFIRDKFKISILLIEHDMDLVMGICERLYVLNFGRIIASGLPEEIQNNKEVITAYLGE